MSRKQSFLKAVVVWGVAATVTIALSIQPQSFAQSPTTEGSTTTPTLESAQGFQRVFSLSGHTNDIVSLAISPDGQTLISGSNDKTIKLWNLKTGQLLYTLTEVPL